jgi:hypothetical protein
MRTSRTSKYWVANNFNICLNFKACNWAQFSSDLQNSNSFEKLRFSSIIFAKKFFFHRARMLRTRHAYISIYINFTSRRWDQKLFALFLMISNRWKPESNEIEPNRNHQKIESAPIRFLGDKNRTELNRCET